MLTHYLKELSLPSRLELHQLTELFADHFLYEEERGLLLLKSNQDIIVDINDFKIELSRLGVSSSIENYSIALRSKAIKRIRWVDICINRLPDWDGQDRIKELASHFELVNSSEVQDFDIIFRYWIVKAAQMLLEAHVNSAVNRLVFCIQSDQQGIGKTTFARTLTKPFDEALNPSVYEMDRPDFTKDSRIELAKNVIVILDDINNWQSSGLKGMKSVISSKIIKVRPPYGAVSIAKPRTASFFATTNELGFLNEEQDTRWAVFRVKGLDWSYTEIDFRQLWSQACQLAKISKEVQFNDKLREICLRSAAKHQLKTELDEMVAQYIEIDEESSQTSYDIFEQLPYDFKRVLGSGMGAVSKLGKAFTRVFGKKQSYPSGGYTKWKLRFKSNRL
jgi:hypothetical protein